MDKFRNKIDEHGSELEKMGLTPVAARVYVYLLFQTKEGATFEEILHYFKVSKSAVSNALKMLEAVSMIGSKTYGGRRKRYFFVNFNATLNTDYMSQKFIAMADILKDIKNARNREDAFAQDMEEVILFYQMMLIEIPIIVERWKRAVELNRSGTPARMA